MKLTRSGVAHDLSISPHRRIVQYENEEDIIIYVFSSKLVMEIFDRKLQEHREKIKESLSKRFGFTIKHDKLSDLVLYSRTEKRGFLVIAKEEFNCLENIKLDGVNLTLRN